MNNRPLKQLLSQLFHLPPFHPVYVTEESQLVSRSRNSHPQSKNIKEKLWQFHTICGALLLWSTNSFTLWLVLESQEQEVGPKWESGKEIVHFSTAAYGFLISLCKGKPGAGRAL